MNDRAHRAIAECLHLATMTEEPGRITRRFLTSPVRQIHAHLRRRMQESGMSVHVDPAGNLRGLWTPAGASSKRLILGSHIDTVPDAGAFDGVLGVTLSLEWVSIAQQLRLPMPIEVIAFSEEEGVRFGVPFIGSRAVAGRFNPALLDLADPDGITLRSAIRDFDLDPENIAHALMDPNTAAFVELHIEQGPLLEAEGLSVAAVSGIVGQTRLSFEFTGQANHAGTTPMGLRRDALAGAAEWIAAVESIANSRDNLVATCGKISAEPNAANVIPGIVRVSLDVRHLRDSQREAAAEELVAKARAIARRRGLTVSVTSLMNEPAVPMDERLTSYLVDSIEAAGHPPKTMPSGAGHDAMVMAARVPTAMLFLRSPGGVSHHPNEAVLEKDVIAALEVGSRFLPRLAAAFHD